MTKSPTKQVEEMTAEAQKTMEEGVEKMTKGMEDAAAFGQETMDAMTASSKIAARAMESVNAEIMAYSKKSYEDGLAAAKEMTSCKSVTELFEQQTQYSKLVMDGFMSHATKLNELYAAAAKEVFEPINSHFTTAMDRAKSFGG
ncbi:MAG: phasin family protein [Pseudomonadota bacterium]